MAPMAMYARSPVRVAVFCHGTAERVWRLALAAAEGAWDAGGEVRVRRLGPLVPPGTVYACPELVRVLRDAEHVPEAEPADLAWADAALFGTATPYGVALDRLTLFVDAAVPLWRAGRLGGKVYGAFTAAAGAHGGPERRLASLTDVFHHWGGVIVPLEGRDPIGGHVGEPGGAAAAVPGAPSDPEGAAAWRQGRRVTETAGALAAGRSSSPTWRDGWRGAA
jgi:NAD(P)H dehydrogenase (quinone)